MRDVTGQGAAWAAYLASALNLLAVLAMLLVLKPGLPVQGNLLQERLAYISGHVPFWWTGWLLWHAAAIALLAFYVGLAGQWSRTAPIRCRLALLCAASGMAADISAEALYMSLAGRLGPDVLPTVDAVSGLLTGYVGNGLYTVAGILLVWAGGRDLPRPLLVLSIPVWVAGLSLSAASLAGSAAGQLWSTAVLMPAFVLWTGLMGRWLQRRAS